MATIQTHSLTESLPGSYSTSRTNRRGGERYREFILVLTINNDRFGVHVNIKQEEATSPKSRINVFILSGAISMEESERGPVV